MATRFCLAMSILAMVFLSTLSTNPALGNPSDLDISIELPRNQQILYIGIENPFFLNLCGISHEDVLVEIDNGGKVQFMDGRYVAVVYQQSIHTITVSKNNEQRSVIGSFKLRAKLLPDPTILFSNYRPGDIPLGAFKVQQGITAVLEGFGFDLPIKIISFDFIHVSTGQPSSFHKIEGAWFPAEVKELMKTTTVGDYIILDNIQIDILGGRVLSAVIFRLT